MELLLLLILIAVALRFVKRWRRFARKLTGRGGYKLRSRSNYAKPKFKPFDAQKSRSQHPHSQIIGKAYVVDGDTLVINKTQIRLFGIDAPEMNHPFGQKAKWALVSLCKGQVIKAEITELDDYGRAVARCSLEDGTDISAEMVALGLAIDWPKFSGGEYREYEVPDARQKMWLADARQKGRMHVWDQFEARQKAHSNKPKT